MGLRFGEPPPCKNCGNRVVGIFNTGRVGECEKCGALFCKKCASKLMKEEDGELLCRDCWIVLSLEKLRKKEK